MTGIKPSFLEFRRYMDLHNAPPQLMNLLEIIYNVLEDVYSVGSMTELQDAIDGIGTGAGTIFIEAGTHQITIPIDVDGGGSLVIYGHGDNTILQPDDGINVFNITDCASLTIKNLQIDATNYTGATSGVIVNETNDNVISLEDVTIIGNNLGTGIELVSNNCIIEHCNISLLQDGIYVNNSNRHIIAQNTLSNNTRYGINLDTSLYSSINGNFCNSNLMGIYLDSSANSSISNNICNLNTKNGIYLTTSSYNTISGNTCENNDSNTALPQAGIFITTNSDFNTITGNSVNNNNNIGVGFSYGIYIATATCDENIIASNNANGNDIDYEDEGTATTIIYYVQNEDELQDAIDSIGTGTGTIVITAGAIGITVPLDIDGGGSYIIEGQGDNTIFIPDSDIVVFNVTNAIYCEFRNFKVDTINGVLNFDGNAIFTINETGDNLVSIHNITVTDSGSNNYGNPIRVSSENVRIQNCYLNDVHQPIRLSVGGNNAIITGNVLENVLFGIELEGVFNCLISDNVLIDGSNGGMVYLNSGCEQNVISNNTITGSGEHVGIQLESCNSNTIIGNKTNGACAVGIYLHTCDYCNIIGNNFSEANYQSIRLTNSNKNSVTGNICSEMAYNIASDYQVIWLQGDSDYNIITGNSLVDNINPNVGGIYYGIQLDAGCDNNTVKNNVYSGTEKQILDNGINNQVEYICTTGQEIQDSIDSIATKSGIITLIDKNITLAVVIDVDGGGDYIIEGKGIGSVLTPDGDTQCINISSANSVILRNFKIDGKNLTTATTEIIYIDEGVNNRVTVEKISIIGDVDKKGYGIYANSDNIKIIDCYIYKVNIGIAVIENYINVSNCFIEECAVEGIYVNGVYHCQIINNFVYSGGYGYRLNNMNYSVFTNNIAFYLTSVGIRLGTTSVGNTISNNICYNNTGTGLLLQTGADKNLFNGNIIQFQAGWGIDIEAGADTNIIGINYLSNNTSGNFRDAGANNRVFGDDTAYDEATWNGDLGTPTKNAIRDKIESLVGGAYSGWFDDGVNFRVTVVDGIITAVANSTGGGHNP